MNKVIIIVALTLTAFFAAATVQATKTSLQADVRSYVATAQGAE